jgi:protein involved in polysaccharide export with SLBB domain
MNRHLFKWLSLWVALLIVSTTQVHSQFKPGDGIYIVVALVPEECKASLDGHYVVTKEGKISFAFMNENIAADRNIEEIRAEITQAIRKYCRIKFPDEFADPGVDIVPDTKTIEAGENVMVVGQVRKPGVVPIKEGLTVFQAYAAAGGGTEWSSCVYVSILRNKKTIDCDFTKIEYTRTPVKSGDVIVVPLKCFKGDSPYSRKNVPPVATPAAD